MSADYFEPPATVPSPDEGNEVTVSRLAIQYLVSTQPWVRLASILGSLTAIALAAVFLVSGSADRWVGANGDFFVACVTLTFLHPLTLLYKYSAAILRLKQNQNAAALEHALDVQRAFWKFVAILLIVAAGLWLYIFAVSYYE
jgi:hypothetical protein